MKRIHLLAMLAWCLTFTGIAVHAVAQDDPYVPPALKQWVKWVEEGIKDRNCSWSPSGILCSWPTALTLELTRDGGKFNYSVYLDTETLVPLPGNNRVWPQNVRLASTAGTALTVVLRNGLPYVRLSSGRHTIVGDFSWTRMPDSFPLPEGQALLKVSVNEQPLSDFTINSNNELWLNNSASEKKTDQDSIQVVIYRQLVDEVPFRILTRMELRVSGRAREFAPGKILPANSQPVSVTSTIPYQYTPQDGLLLQIKPGNHSVTIDSRIATPPASLSLPENSHPDIPEEEVWSWVRNERHRSVELVGPSQIDPGQTNLPQEWKSFPAYLLTAKDTLTFDTRQRGEEQTGANGLNLTRNIWLDQDGRGYTLRDIVRGTIKRDWRLSMYEPVELGQVQIDDQNQLITILEKGKRGVEVRNEYINLVADSRLENAREFIPAVGWDQDMDSASLTLHLPPGWELLHAEGVDSSNNTWVSHWTLLSVFGVVLISVATFRLFGITEALIALTTLLLIHARPGAPFQIWFHLLACIGLLRVVPPGNFRKITLAYAWTTSFVLILAVLSFATHEIVIALFPQLADNTWTRHVFIYYSLIDEFLILAGILAVVVLGIWTLVALFKQKRRLLALLTAICAAASIPFLLLLLEVGRSPSLYRSAEYDQRTVSNYGAAVQRFEESVMSPAGYSMSDRMEKKKSKQLLQRNDPSARLQTGPGVPEWNWRTWELSWSGPVSTGEQIHLWLVTPAINSALGLLRCLLILTMSVLFLRAVLPKGRLRPLPSYLILPLLVVTAVTAVPVRVQAEDFPPPDLLSELEKRLHADKCRSDCTFASSVHFSVTEDEFLMTAVIHSSGKGSWGIPGPISVLTPDQLTLDGKSDVKLRADSSRQLWIQVEDGVHNLKMQGKLTGGNAITIQLPSTPRHVAVDAVQWEIDGISPTGVASGSIQLVRRAKSSTPAADNESDKSSVLPRWYRIHRELDLGSDWNVTTTVTRIGDVTRAETVRLSLLEDEAVTSEQRVSGRSILVSFARGSSTAAWYSTMNPVSLLNFRASETQNVTEEWTLRCSSIFHCTYQGTNPFYSINGGEHVVHWKPWPKEEVEISVTRPAASPGNSITIDKVHLSHNPGVRLLSTTLQITIRSSRGGRLQVHIPKDAELVNTLINNDEYSLRFEDGVLSIPVSLGTRNVLVTWRHQNKLGAATTFPTITLPQNAVNIHNQLQIPRDRWVLWASGPAWGPVFLYWGQLLFILIIAVAAGYYQLGNLTILEWLLLGIGVSVLPIPLMVIPPFWLMLIQYRRQHSPSNFLAHNAFQLLLAFLTMVVLVLFYHIAQTGLIGSPDMNVIGSGSSNFMLNWYTDRISDVVPVITLYSVPMWVWRAVMFLWSCWAAYALLRWLTNAWHAFQNGGMWRWKLREDSKSDSNS